jgi:hypothetical protein
VDSEVARTLAELERKLQDLERALDAGGREHPAQEAPAYEPASASGAVGTFTDSGARLVDERLESASPVPGPPQTYAERQAPSAPAPAPPRDFDDSIELVELARFRDRLEQTMRELLADYERIIRLRSLSQDRDPVE